MGRSPSFDDCLKDGEELQAHLRRRSRRAADPRRRPGPRGHRPQQLDPRRRGRDRRPPADRDRAPAARRGPRRAGRERRQRQAGALLQDRHPVLDGTDRGDRPAEDGLPRPAQPRRDRGRGRDHRALAGRADRHRGDPARRRARPTRCSRAATRSASSSSSPTGMRDALREVRPTEFDDIVALVALYRPGAMRFIDDYARRQARPLARSATPDERLRPITESTYGCCIYQEQLMEIAKQMAGLQPGRGRRPAQGGGQEEARPDGPDEGQVPRRDGRVRTPTAASRRTSGR